MKTTLFRPLAKIFVVTGSMVVGAKIPYTLLDTPGTFHTFFLCLSALYMSRYEALAGQVLYLILGFFMPVFSSVYYGMDVYSGDSAGFLFAFPIAAFMLAHLSKKGRADWFTILSLCVFAHAIVLTGGFLWVWLNGRYEVAEAADRAIIFLLPGAFMKSILATLVFVIAEKFLNQKEKNV